MKMIKRDVNLWLAKKSSDEENKIVTHGLANKGVMLIINGVKTQFVPLKGAKGLKPIEAPEWLKIKYGTTVEVNYAHGK